MVFGCGVQCHRLCKSPNTLQERKAKMVVAANHTEVVTTCRRYVVLLLGGWEANMGETAAVGGDGDSREAVGECPPRRRRRSGVGCVSYISMQQRDAGNTSSYGHPPRRRSRRWSSHLAHRQGLPDTCCVVEDSILNQQQSSRVYNRQRQAEL
jgi:hypothetical protein